MPLLFPIDREIERKDEPPSNAGLIDEEKRAWIREHKRYIRPMVIINTRSVAFPPLILRSATEQRKKSEARKEEGMLEQEKER